MGPAWIAFDGTNMWVTNFDGGTVTELSPTGATLGTYAFGTDPVGIAFDGTNMWVTGATNVTDLSPTGAKLSTFPGIGPDSSTLIGFDGTDMWMNDFGNVASPSSRR
jgi:DNA-binding beta-propeller fold protein YncE